MVEWNPKNLKFARGPNNKYLVDSDGNYILDMHDLISYYFSEILVNWWLNGPDKKDK